MRRGRLSLREYWASRPSPFAVFAAFAIDDPLPGILDLPVLVPRLVRRGWQRSERFHSRDIRRRFEARRGPLLKTRVEYDRLR
jgi:predicted ATP-grasp superfamily ATP-dependent carboligase